MRCPACNHTFQVLEDEEQLGHPCPCCGHEDEPYDCDHKWRDYSEYGGDFLKTPVVCKHCGKHAPAEITVSVLVAELAYMRQGHP